MVEYNASVEDCVELARIDCMGTICREAKMRVEIGCRKMLRTEDFIFGRRVMVEECEDFKSQVYQHLSPKYMLWQS